MKGIRISGDWGLGFWRSGDQGWDKNKISSRYPNSRNPSPGSPAYRMHIIISSFIFFLLIGYSFAQFNPSTNESAEYSKYPKIKVLQTVYYAHHWSDYGRYKRVTKNKKRLGNYAACNFLPGGSIIMIPELFRTTKFEVADTFGGKGYGFYKGEKYWKVDILRNKDEWLDDFDYPMDMYIVKFNKGGPVKNRQVGKNCQMMRKLLF